MNQGNLRNDVNRFQKMHHDGPRLTVWAKHEPDSATSVPMNTKTTYFVVLAAIVLGALFLVVERGLLRPSSSPEIEQRASNPSGKPSFVQLSGEQPAFTADHIAQVHIEVEGKPAVLITRESGGWVQAEPVRFDADASAVDRLLNQLLTLPFTKKFIPTEKQLTLDQLGFSPAQCRLRLSDKEGKPLATVQLGKKALAGGAYICLDSPTITSDVYVVDDSLHQLLLHAQPHAWRSKSLISAPIGPADRVVLTTREQVITLDRTGNGWNLAPPHSGRADSTLAQQLSRVLQDARIEKFIQDKPSNISPFGLDKPYATLAVRFTPLLQDQGAADVEPITHTLLVGSTQSLEDNSPRLAMLQGVPVVFTIAKSSLDLLDTSIDKLRDSRLTPLQDAQISKVILEKHGEVSLSLTRDAAGWKFGEPFPGFDLEQGQAKALLEAFLGGRADSFVPNFVPTSQPEMVVRFESLTGSPGDVLKVYADGESDYIVVRGEENVGYRLARTRFEIAAQPLLLFRNLTAWDLNQSQIDGVEIVRSGEYPATYSFKHTESGWHDGLLDDKKVQALLSLLAPLRADRWLAEDPVTTPEGVAIHLALKDGTTRKLFIHPESRVAKLDGLESPFVASKELVELLTAELSKTLVLDLASDQIANVRLNDILIYRGPAGQYVVENGTLSEAAPGAMFDALAGLVVERFIPLENARVDAAAPDYKLSFTTRADTKQALHLWSPGDSRKQWVGRLEDKTEAWLLDEATALKLTGQPSEARIPSK